MKRMIINGPGYLAVTEDDMLVEYIPYDQQDENGSILLGKAGRMMPGLQCAFVDIGRKKNAFLPMKENSTSFCGGDIRSGEMIILQIKKEETGGKGAYLTRDITLPGRFVIVMPMNRYVGVSSRITDSDIRERLKNTGKSISGGRYGIVMRNSASQVRTEELRSEAEELYMMWQQINEKAKEGGTPGRELWSNTPDKRLKEDYEAGGYETAWEEETNPIISRQLRLASERTLRLPSGGNIIIDRCEAMTVIDVNTASDAGNGPKEKTVLETNMEACTMIMQQIRLRNLSGIILIDFIDMDNETDRCRVLERLTECFRNDRIKTVIHGWTKLGIMEMTRKRTGKEMKYTEE